MSVPRNVCPGPMSVPCKHTSYSVPMSVPRNVCPGPMSVLRKHFSRLSQHQGTHNCLQHLINIRQ